MEKSLETLLNKRFQPVYLDIANHSHLHHGHAGSPDSGDSHFKILIVSPDFENIPRLQRHRLVNEAVKPLFDEGLHALSLSLFTPDEYDRNN